MAELPDLAACSCLTVSMVLPCAAIQGFDSTLYQTAPTSQPATARDNDGEPIDVMHGVLP